MPSRGKRKRGRIQPRLHGVTFCDSMRIKAEGQEAELRDILGG